MTAMNGVLLFGWSTAVIFEVLQTTPMASGNEAESAKEASSADADMTAGPAQRASGVAAVTAQ
jgi:hypothetical protein